MERTTACAVVMVDDEDADRGAPARMLAACGCRVADFAAAAAALVHLTERGADLLVTDLEMPEVDGAELFAAVQARGLARRIVWISGRGEDHCHARVEAVGGPPDRRRRVETDLAGDDLRVRGRLRRRRDAVTAQCHAEFVHRHGNRAVRGSKGATIDATNHQG